MARETLIGEVVGGYVLEGVLGSGGMGTVYGARHELLGRDAAVKVLAPKLAEDADFVSRFFQEARIVNSVRHPNIVDIIDFIDTTEPRRVAFVMELVPGRALDELLGEERPSILDVCTIGRQIAGALAAVHEAGIVHRDLKPANVIVDGTATKVLDFGIAKIDDGSTVDHQTMTGMVLGTPAYMAPEQVAGDVVSGATDVYALGTILYELATGQRLFTGPNAATMCSKVGGKIPPLYALQTLPAGASLHRIVTACLAFDPRSRPSMTDLIAALDGVEAELTSEIAAVPPPYAAAPALPMPTASILPEDMDVIVPPPRERRWLLAGTGSICFGVAIAIAIAASDAEPAVTVVPIAPAPSAAVLEAPEPTAAPVPVAPVPAAPTEPAAEVERAARPARVAAAPKRRSPRPRRPSAKTTNVPAAPDPAPSTATPKPTAPGTLDVQAWTTGGRSLPAAVRIDGVDIDGRTPMKTTVVAGTHRVAVAAPGYPTTTKTIRVREGEARSVYVVVDLESRSTP